MIFAISLVLLALLAQQLVLSHGTEGLSMELYPMEPLPEPEEDFQLCLVVENARRLPIPFIRLSLQLPPEVSAPKEPFWTANTDGRVFSFSTWLRPRERLERRITLKAQQRGRYILNRLTLSRGDFLGLSEEQLPLDRFVEVVIPPKELAFPALSVSTGSFLGRISQRRFLHEDPVLTVGFREYTGREPLKQISWVQSARVQGLMVKSYDYSTDPVITVLLNGHTRSYGQEEALEQCFSITRSVCTQLEQKRIPYALYTNVGLAGGWQNQDRLFIPQGLGETHFRRVLELLGRATTFSTQDGEALLLRAMPQGNAQGLILISTTDGLPHEASLNSLRERSGNQLLILTPEAMGEVAP